MVKVDEGRNNFGGFFSHATDLVDVVAHELRVVELHVAVDRALAEQPVVVVVLVVASLNHCQVLPAFVVHLGEVRLLDGQLRDVVVDPLCAGGSALHQPSRVKRSVNIVQWSVGLTTLVHYRLHHIHSRHGLNKGEQGIVLLDNVLDLFDVVIPN